MGICSLITRKLDVPGEDAWIELRPISAKRFHAIELEAKRLARAAIEANPDDADAENYASTSLILNAAIVAWSYPCPVDAEHVDDLEPSTQMWIAEQLNKGAEVPLASSPPSTESSVVETE
jgi:hypothetical protein